ncbi:MAG: zinc-binding dehydrogenase [Christensenellales bacterium]
MKKWIINKEDGVAIFEDVSQRREGQVKVKMSKVAVSSQDVCHLSTLLRENAVVPGHSAVAHVSEADEDSGLKLGARVVISPYVSTSEHGEEVVKTMGVDVDGLLCDFACVPFENVFVLPDGISDEEALFCEYIAMGNNVFEALDREKGDYIVIVGASTLGLVLGQMATYYQYVPILVDLDADRLALAQKWGVSYTLNPTYDNLERRVEEITGGRMAEAAISSGDSVDVNAAMRLVKNHGDVIVAGYATRGNHAVDASTVLKKQLTIKGVCNGIGEMSSAINLLANKVVKTDGIFGASANFDEIPQVVENCIKYPYQYGKILINCDD